jgi:hypothetical protein
MGRLKDRNAVVYGTAAVSASVMPSLEDVIGSKVDDDKVHVIWQVLWQGNKHT